MAKKTRRTPAQVAKDRTIRAAFKHRPSLGSLVASNDYTGPIPQSVHFNMMLLSANFKRAREAANLSLADVAALTGMDRSAISRIENGLADNPTVATLARLAHAMGKKLQFELTDE
jgi:DNA-binding XRE family transcriptional regulator